jgi:hypothetical protein
MARYTATQELTHDTKVCFQSGDRLPGVNHKKPIKGISGKAFQPVLIDIEFVEIIWP